jgi:hypothetical protein
MENLKFNAWYCNEHLGVFETLKEARECIYNHPAYKKSYFTKKGKASSKNPNEYESFAIYDNQGYGYYIR